MEKKGSRSVQPSTKGLTSDSKKNQDGASGKLWPRSGRRREPSGSSLAAKNESSRKPTPQRTGKTYDIKRPRPRGACSSDSPVDRTETTRLEDDLETEWDPVYLKGGKKPTLNHLLNFNYGAPSRDGRYQCERGFRNKNSKKHKYNKEEFVQAHCQFVVNTSGDYKQYMNNPDALVDWSLIEQVNFQATDYQTCPICLHPPVAAKMTKCGHIYCWSCLLHYLSLSDETSRECPICFVLIHKQELKSVTSKQYKTFNVGDVITFKLMKRLKGSLVTYPTSAIVREDEIFYMSDRKSEAYSKLLVANQVDVLSIIERENDELIALKIENGECPENCFIEEALSLLNERRDSVLRNWKPEAFLTDKIEKESKVERDSLYVREALDNLEINDDNDTSSSESVNVSSSIEVENLDISTNSHSKFYYFYQASDGQHIYLHAINARMLEHTYGSLEQCPCIITGRILEKEPGSVTEEVRRRRKYLQHLPITCNFEEAEIHLKPPMVSKETLQQFNEQIESRKKQRQRRAREEKRREKKIAEKENRLLGKYPVPNIHIESQIQFPCFEGRARPELEGPQSSEGSLPESLVTPPNSLGTEHEHPGPSFAKMLASAKKPETNKWPALKPSPAPTKLINVTGQKMNSTSFVKLRNKSDSEPEVDEFEPLPPSTSLGDAIVQALQKAEENEMLNEPGTLPMGKKKKIKNRQKVLFTTTLAYTGK